MKRNWQNQKIYGMRAKTYVSVLVVLGFMFVTVIIGKQFKKQENITAHYYNTTKAYAEKIISLTTYHEPLMASFKDQARAKYIIAKVWGKDYKTGLAIASCESGLREKVVNSIGAVGYFQVLSSAHGLSIEDLKNGLANAGYAYSLYKEQGLTPWNASRSCWKERI